MNSLLPGNRGVRKMNRSLRMMEGAQGGIVAGNGSSKVRRARSQKTHKQGDPKKPVKKGANSTGQGAAGNDDDDDDVCPTCLELYDEDNPKIFAACGHHFHLACIYEWYERSRTCPVCLLPMKFEELS